MSCRARVDVPSEALSSSIPQKCWFNALVGPGGQAQQRLIKGSGCHAISLRSDTDEMDLRIAAKLYVEVRAPSNDDLLEGVRRVRLAIEDVMSEHGVSLGGRSPPTPLLATQQAAEPVVVQPPTALEAPPPAWGPPPPPPAAAAADEGEQTCGLCMADVVANVRLEPCGHYACVACVAGLRRRALFVSTAGVPCPFCRTIVVHYTAPPGVDVGVQPAAAPETSLALRATLPPLEIRQPPPAAVSKVSREPPLRPKHKTTLCARWRESGTCDFGSRCHFAHGEAELRVLVREFAPHIVSPSSAVKADTWRAASSTAVPSVAVVPQRRAETAKAAAVLPPDLPAVAASAALSEPPPAEVAAAPVMPAWLAFAVGAQQPASTVPGAAVAATRAAASDLASTSPEAALAGTPWEFILRLEDNGF